MSRPKQNSRNINLYNDKVPDTPEHVNNPPGYDDGLCPVDDPVSESAPSPMKVAAWDHANALLAQKHAAELSQLSYRHQNETGDLADKLKAAAAKLMAPVVDRVVEERNERGFWGWIFATLFE